MKQVLVKSGKVYIEDVPCPAVAPGMALVRVSHSLISSGTESGFVSEGGAAGFLLKKARDPLNVEKVKRKIASVGVKGTIDLIRSKVLEFQAPGYSTAGVVIECGEGVTGFRAGDRVACAGVGYASHAEYNLVPEQLLTPLPDEVSFEEGAFVALGAIALQGVRQAAPALGETIVVLGLGLLGQLTAQLLRAAGCHVIGCDPLAPKRELAQQLGADAVCTPEELPGLAGELSGGHGADAVIICAASKTSTVTRQACDVCRQKGRVVVVGAVGLELEREPLYLKEIDFRLSCSYGPGRYNPAYEERGLDYPIGYVRWTEGRNMSEFLRLVAEQRVRVRELITSVSAVDEAQRAYDAVLKGEGAAIAALLRYDMESSPAAELRRTLVLKAASPVAGSLGVAVIGAGAFAQGYHLPNLKKISGCHLEAVVAKTGSKAKQVAERFGARYCTTDYREVLADERVQAVLIATRHNLHKEIALAAVEAGKHVFVEKPLALTAEDAREIVDAVARKGVLLTVGFNRRFSEYVRLLKKAFDSSAPGPKTILYRCNAGALPKGHWAADPVEGGGRILGEAVHFYDFCCWLVGSAPVSIEAQRLGPSGAAAEDDVTALLRFADGSLATVAYCTTGHTLLGKERIECMGSGGAFVIEDFKRIVFPPVGEKAFGKREDKGQRQMLEHFIRAVRGEGPLEVTAEDGLRATRIACEVLRAAQRGPVVAGASSPVPLTSHEPGAM